MSEPYRIDPHVKVLDEALVERAAARGLDAVVYAPHFTRWPDVERRAAELTTDDLLVLPGREVFTGTFRNRKHVLGIDLEAPVPDFVTLEAAMAEFERQDATVLAPHPEYLTVGLAAADLRRYRDVIDGVEVYNPKHLPWHNRRARTLAEDLDLPAFGSSYAHLRGTVGDVWIEVEPEGVDAIDDADDVVDAIANAERRVCRRTSVGPRLRSAAEFAHLGWENSWKKFGRVLGQGLEPTHPHDEIYEGRFDDACVY